MAVDLMAMNRETTLPLIRGPCWTSAGSCLICIELTQIRRRILVVLLDGLISKRLLVCLWRQHCSGNQELLCLKVRKVHAHTDSVGIGEFGVVR